jgi:hypothetical protein
MLTAMTELRVRPVDPRDTSWEVWNGVIDAWYVP